MSYLRQIMERLRDRSPSPPQDRRSDDALLEEHLRLYGSQLEACSDAMLDYEAAWLEQHIETLELCAREPTMQAGAGGAQHVEQLLEESRRFRRLLNRHRHERGLGYRAVHATVVASEHAWELSDPALRRAWGFPAAPSS
ncbi:MAG: hypothetical protein ER33_06800 [Cyanobium sp. CACIAM 14]|nr:MAG: hypothetical protein ER33_06800 [Cyanobium sp. CACIAM 14]